MTNWNEWEVFAFCFTCVNIRFSFNVLVFLYSLNVLSHYFQKILRNGSLTAFFSSNETKIKDSPIFSSSIVAFIYNNLTSKYILPTDSKYCDFIMRMASSHMHSEHTAPNTERGRKSERIWLTNELYNFVSSTIKNAIVDGTVDWNRYCHNSICSSLYCHNFLSVFARNII